MRRRFTETRRLVRFPERHTPGTTCPLPVALMRLMCRFVAPDKAGVIWGTSQCLARIVLVWCRPWFAHIDRNKTSSCPVSVYELAATERAPASQPAKFAIGILGSRRVFDD